MRTDKYGEVISRGFANFVASASKIDHKVVKITSLSVLPSYRKVSSLKLRVLPRKSCFIQGLVVVCSQLHFASASLFLFVLPRRVRAANRGLYGLFWSPFVLGGGPMERNLTRSFFRP
jgi:hypothetical protein